MGQALPQPNARRIEIEIRQVFETADFGDALTPELSERRSVYALRRRDADNLSCPRRGAGQACPSGEMV